MAVASFDALCAGFCEILGMAVPSVGVDDQGIEGFHATLHDVTFSVLYRPRYAHDHVFVVFELGTVLDDGGHSHQLALLLDANCALLRPDAPTFSRDGESGLAMLQYTLPLARVSPVELIEVVDQGLAAALRWRQASPLRTPTPAREEAVPQAMFA